MKDPNSKTMTVSLKVTPYEKMIYNKKARSNGISFSEWAGTILDIYQNAYSELKINPYREEELLNEIDKLNRQVKLLEALNALLKIELDSRKAGLHH